MISTQSAGGWLLLEFRSPFLLPIPTAGLLVAVRACESGFLRAGRKVVRRINLSALVLGLAGVMAVHASGPHGGRARAASARAAGWPGALVRWWVVSHLQHKLQ